VSASEIAAAADGGIGPVLISARSFAEYTAMFALTEADLSGAVLDCPGGAASFTATALARGFDVTAVDPAYVGGEGALQVLGEHAASEAERGHAFLLAHAHRFVWTYFQDPAEQLRQRIAAAAEFAASVLTDPQRYVPGALPHLPFPDRSFDLVLCSHLLFTYSDRLDAELHLAALREMARVSRKEVRIFPLLGHVDGKPYPHLVHLREALTGDGISSHVRQVDYEFQQGGDEMLVLTLSAGPADSTDEDRDIA
jgi:SAM-dependent methyltransferase